MRPSELFWVCMCVCTHTSLVSSLTDVLIPLMIIILSFFFSFAIGFTIYIFLEKSSIRNVHALSWPHTCICRHWCATHVRLWWKLHWLNGYPGPGMICAPPATTYSGLLIGSWAGGDPAPNSHLSISGYLWLSDPPLNAQESVYLQNNTGWCCCFSLLHLASLEWEQGGSLKECKVALVYLISPVWAGTGSPRVCIRGQWGQ